MNINKLEEILKQNNQPGFRVEQIKKAVFKDGVFSFLEISVLPADLRKKLNENFKILPFEVEKVLVASDANSAKASLKLEDGNLVETVLISPKPGVWSICISCQVGCALGCQFCATGQMGFKRNLSAEEIWSQVLFWKQYLHNLQISDNKSQINSKTNNYKIISLPTDKQKLKVKNYDFSNIVYMGMGEPFLNWENVSESLKVLTDKKMLGFGSRSISVSTAGIAEGIEKLAKEFPQVNLALSLHFADDQKRSKYMPINRKYDLLELRDALRKYLEKTNRKVFLEYILLENINDTKEDADKLIRWIESIGKRQLLHVNLIRYNRACKGFASSSKNKAVQFKGYLLKNKIKVTIRKSLGDEIQGACGQLAGK